MGVVYEAEQTSPVHRRVALKVLRPGFESAEIVARFDAERQALAVMIARVHREGARRRRQRRRQPLLRDGAGPRASRSPTTATPHKLSTRDRVALFIPVCRADAARPPEGRHPPRPQAVEHPGRRGGRPADAQGHRLRHRQGHRPAAHREDPDHPVRPGGRHAGLHEPGAGRDVGAGRRHPHRRLQPRRGALRDAGRAAADRSRRSSGSPGSWPGWRCGRPTRPRRAPSWPPWCASGRCWPSSATPTSRVCAASSAAISTGSR